LKRTLIKLTVAQWEYLLHNVVNELETEGQKEVAIQLSDAKVSIMLRVDLATHLVDECGNRFLNVGLQDNFEPNPEGLFIDDILGTINRQILDAEQA